MAFRNLFVESINPISNDFKIFVPHNNVLEERRCDAIISIITSNGTREYKSYEICDRDIGHQYKDNQ